eukprot:m51a1_g8100 hypothetical protein (247) ;mRNA; r:82193-83052
MLRSLTPNVVETPTILPVVGSPVAYALHDLASRLPPPAAPAQLPPTPAAPRACGDGALDRALSRAVALALSQVCLRNEQCAPAQCAATTGEFCSRRGRQSELTLGEYVRRLMAHMFATADEMVAALALVDRVLVAPCGTGGACRGPVTLSWRTVHRLYAAALVVTVKFTHDDCYRNNYYAHVVGVPPEELYELEVAVLTRAAFEAWVGPADVARYLQPVTMLAEAIIAEEEAVQEPACKRARTDCC